MSWEFRTQPHPARKIVFGKPVVLITDVLMLQVKDGDRWMQIGYCGAKPDRPCTLLGSYPDEFTEAVTAFVTEQIGAPSRTLLAITSKPDEDDE